MAPKMSGMPKATTEKPLRKEKTKGKGLAKSKSAADMAASITPSEGRELKVFTFEAGPLGMKFEAQMVEGCAQVHVSEIQPDSQAATLGVSIGAIIRIVGHTDVRLETKQAKVIKALGDAGRPLEIAMEVAMAAASEEATGAAPAPAPAPVETEEERAAREAEEAAEAERLAAEKEAAEREAAERAEADRLEEIERAKRAEAARLRAIERAKQEAAEEVRRQEEAARKAAEAREKARRDAAAAVIQKRVRGRRARERFVIQKRMRRLREADAIDYCIVRGEARAALTVVQAQLAAMAAFPAEQRAQHRRLLRTPAYLDQQVKEYLDAVRVEEQSVRSMRQAAEAAEESLREAERVAAFKSEQARLAGEQAKANLASQRTDLDARFVPPGAATLQEARANLAQVAVPKAVAPAAAAPVAAAEVAEPAGALALTFAVNDADGYTTISWSFQT